MKKNVIALAVAAAMAAPLAAQAEVSISGGLQAEVISVGGDGGKAAVVSSSGPVLGGGGLATGLYASDGGQFGSENGGSYGFLKFSASEDLGGGMKALAMWNSAVNVGDSGGNNGGMGGRDAYIGLTGGFGTVLAGTLSTPYKSSTVSWDPFVMTSLQARGNGGMSDAQNGYANKFGPATVVLAYVLDEGADQSAGADGTKTNGENAVSFSVNAPVGPVEVAVAYVGASKFSDIRDLGLSGTATLLGAVADALAGNPAGTTTVSYLNTLTATKVGVKWVSGPITVAGQYEMLSLKVDAGDKSIDPTVMYLTASYAMGANTVSAAYGQTAWDLGAAEDLLGFGLDDTTYMAVGMKHAFSKSTSATIGYRATDMGNVAGAENVISAGMRVGF